MFVFLQTVISPVSEVEPESAMEEAEMKLKEAAEEEAVVADDDDVKANEDDEDVKDNWDDDDDDVKDTWDASSDEEAEEGESFRVFINTFASYI